MRASSTRRSASICCASTCFLASIRAASASRVRSAWVRAISEDWAARRTSTSRSCSSRAYSVSRLISKLFCAASRFLVSIWTRVSCSMSLRSFLRASICSVSLVRPSASKALLALKCSIEVWSRPVSETDSSSRPFMARSLELTCCTFWTKSARCSCSSFMVMPAATERSASTNLPSTRSLSISGCMVRWPSVCAAMAIASLSGFTRT